MPWKNVNGSRALVFVGAATLLAGCAGDEPGGGKTETPRSTPAPGTPPAPGNGTNGLQPPAGTGTQVIRDTAEVFADCPKTRKEAVKAIQELVKLGEKNSSVDLGAVVDEWRIVRYGKAFPTAEAAIDQGAVAAALVNATVVRVATDTDATVVWVKDARFRVGIGVDQNGETPFYVSKVPVGSQTWAVPAAVRETYRAGDKVSVFLAPQKIREFDQPVGFAVTVSEAAINEYVASLPKGQEVERLTAALDSPGRNAPPQTVQEVGLNLCRTDAADTRPVVISI